MIIYVNCWSTASRPSQLVEQESLTHWWYRIYTMHSSENTSTAFQNFRSAIISMMFWKFLEIRVMKHWEDFWTESSMFFIHVHLLAILYALPHMQGKCIVSLNVSFGVMWKYIPSFDSFINWISIRAHLYTNNISCALSKIMVWKLYNSAKEYSLESHAATKIWNKQ